MVLLTELSLFCGISDSTAISQCVTLQKLYMECRKLNSLDFVSHLKELVEFRLSSPLNSQLVLDDAQNFKLLEFYVTPDQLTVLNLSRFAACVSNVSRFAQLETLGLSQILEAFNLPLCRKLVFKYLQMSDLRILQKSHLPELHSLEIQDCLLDSIFGLPINNVVEIKIRAIKDLDISSLSEAK